MRLPPVISEPPETYPGPVEAFQAGMDRGRDSGFLEGILAGLLLGVAAGALAAVLIGGV